MSEDTIDRVAQALFAAHKLGSRDHSWAGLYLNEQNRWRATAREAIRLHRAGGVGLMARIPAPLLDDMVRTVRDRIAAISCGCDNHGVWGEIDADGMPSIRFCVHRQVDDGVERDAPLKQPWDAVLEDDTVTVYADGREVGCIITDALPEQELVDVQVMIAACVKAAKARDRARITELEAEVERLRGLLVRSRDSLITSTFGRADPDHVSGLLGEISAALATPEGGRDDG